MSELAMKPNGSLSRMPRSSRLSTVIVFAVCASLIAKFTTPYMGAASLAYFFLICGILFHSERKVHITFMSLGVLIDLSLVSILEVKRSAIATAVGGTLGLFQMGHIVSSTCAVLCYFPTIAFGIRFVRNAPNGNRRRTHVYFGRIAFAFRTIGFLLMFSLLEHVTK